MDVQAWETIWVEEGGGASFQCMADKSCSVRLYMYYSINEPCDLSRLLTTLLQYQQPRRKTNSVSRRRMIGMVHVV